jgi:hypothetical protein
MYKQSLIVDTNSSDKTYVGLDLIASTTIAL